jgi:uncharacterized membrane protein YccC
MEPVLSFVMPIVLTAVFGLSYIVVYEMVKEKTIGRFVGGLAVALAGALCLDLAIAIIVGV